jgi:hypothetical protein
MNPADYLFLLGGADLGMLLKKQLLKGTTIVIAMNSSFIIVLKRLIIYS